MPVVNQSLEDRLNELAKRCSLDHTSIILEFDPVGEKWIGSVDEEQDFEGDLNEVVEALEAELDI
jgi:hypothetical protein